MQQLPPSDMEYRRLGKTSLRVSAIGLGNWLTADKQEDIDRNKQIVKRAWKLGINFFDTAEGYGFGQAESQLGVALKELNVPREDYVLTTKVFFSDKEGMRKNRSGLSRKHIIEGLKNSLKRLQTDYVDLYFAHRPHYEVPTEEICRAFDWCVRHGLCHYWGTSEFSAAQITEMHGICDRLNLVHPTVEQPEYNMYNRQRFEVEYEQLYEEYGMGTTIWSPLMQGILSGKYNDSLEIEGRMQEFKNHPFLGGFWKRKFATPETTKQFQDTLKQLGEIAKSIGCSQAQLAIAWVLKNKDVSVALTGATRLSQIEDTVQAVKLYNKITPEIEDKIDTLLGTKPLGNFDIKNNFTRRTRREQIYK